MYLYYNVGAGSAILDFGHWDVLSKKERERAASAIKSVLPEIDISER
jgi:hypothetical protein